MSLNEGIPLPNPPLPYLLSSSTLLHEALDMMHKAHCQTFGGGPCTCNPSVQIDPVERDLVNHPPHYTSHPSGIECIQITEHMNFCCGNAVKYIWRADDKGNDLEDLKKARWYIDREIARREAAR